MIVKSNGVIFDSARQTITLCEDTDMRNVYSAGKIAWIQAKGLSKYKFPMVSYGPIEFVLKKPWRILNEHRLHKTILLDQNQPNKVDWTSEDIRPAFGFTAPIFDENDVTIKEKDHVYM